MYVFFLFIGFYYGFIFIFYYGFIKVDECCRFRSIKGKKKILMKVVVKIIRVGFVNILKIVVKVMLV